MDRAVRGPRLNHVNLPARDPEGLAGWYAQRFGFRANGACVVGAETLIVFESGDPIGAHGNTHFGFQVAARGEVAVWAQRFGVPVETDATYAGFKVHDPEGNCFEIYWEIRAVGSPTAARQGAFQGIDALRLRLRHFRDTDLPSLLAYRNDPEIARYQGWDAMSEAEGVAFVGDQSIAQPGVPGQWFQFAIELKSNGLHIGDCALQVKADDARQAEIGFTLSRAHQGHGLAAEAVTRLLDYALPTFGLHRVVATTDVENTRSVALLQRIGMRREAHFIQHVWFKGGWASEFQYAILANEWNRLRHTGAGR